MTRVNLIVETLKDKKIIETKNIITTYDKKLAKEAYTYWETRTTFARNKTPKLIQVPEGSIENYFLNKHKDKNENQIKATPYTNETNIISKYEFKVIGKYQLTPEEEKEHVENIKKIKW